MKMKLEWMYAQGHASNATSYIDEDKEAFLLGKKRVDGALVDAQAAEEKRLDQEAFAHMKASVYGVSANTSRDVQAKVRDDPLLAFKRQEQESLAAVLNNPLRMKQLKEKKEKKPKKEKKDKKSKRHDSPDESKSVRRSPSPPRRRSRSRSPIRNRRSSPEPARRRSRSPTIRRRSRSPPRHHRRYTQVTQPSF
jgi:Pre-mRNA splicing factor